MNARNWRHWMDIGLFGGFCAAMWVGMFPGAARRVLRRVGVEVR